MIFLQLELIQTLLREFGPVSVSYTVMLTGGYSGDTQTIGHTHIREAFFGCQGDATIVE